MTLTLEAIEYQSGKRKASFYIPLEDVVAISFGKVPGDVNTEWVLLRVREGSATRLMGFRDGRKLGYGTRTRKIFNAMRSVLRQAGAGQYAVPPGYRAFDELDSMFTVAFPQGWSIYHHSAIDVDESLILGEAIFSEEPFPTRDAAEPDSARWDEMHERIRVGTIAAFSVLREEPRAGASCSGISKKVASTLVEQAQLQIGGTTDAPRTDAVLIDECKGLRIRFRAQQSDGGVVVLDRRVVSDQRATYTMTLLATPETIQARTAMFNEALATFRFTDAAAP